MIKLSEKVEEIILTACLTKAGCKECQFSNSRLCYDCSYESTKAILEAVMEIVPEEKPMTKLPQIGPNVVVRDDKALGFNQCRQEFLNLIK